MSGKITYTPFIPKFEIPESQAIQPIPISFPISEYRGADPDREVIPVQIPGERLEIKYDLSQNQEQKSKQEPSSVTWRYTPQTNLNEARTTLRGRHQFKTDDIDVGNMQEFLDLAASEGVYFRVTSGLRKGATTSTGKTSNHATGMALDITPLDGQSWEDLISKMKNSPKLRDYMKKKKMRILDERTSDVLAKTGGTGSHFHISFGKTEGRDADGFLASS